MDNSAEYVTAIHEAGHAVVDELVGNRVESLTIEADDETRGHVVSADAYPEDIMDYLWMPWDDPEIVEKLLELAVPLILGCLAGPLAQQRITGEWNEVGASSDMGQIYDLVRAAWPDDPWLNAGLTDEDGVFQALPDLAVESARKRFGADAEALLDEHWDWIVAVAEAAMERKTLTGDEIRAIRPAALT